MTITENTLNYHFTIFFDRFCLFTRIGQYFKQEAKREREGDGILNGSRARNRTQDTRSATALYVSVLPTTLLALTKLPFLVVSNLLDKIMWTPEHLKNAMSLHYRWINKVVGS